MSEKIISFDTDVGECALCIREDYITRFFLPERIGGRLPRKIKLSYQSCETHRVAFSDTVSRIQSYFLGIKQDFSDLPVYQEVYSQAEVDVFEELLQIPYAHTLSYKELAERISRPGAARHVGTILGRNKVPVLVPCHRVILSSGALGGYSAGCGPEMKAKLLEIESQGKKYNLHY